MNKSAGWRVALIDSGSAGRAIESARFDSSGDGPLPTVTDPTGHGSRLALLLEERATAHELILGQVFDESGPTTPRAVAAAIKWAIECGAHLIHLSLGLRRDEPIIADVIQAAIRLRCIVVAAAPARGGPVFPAAYAGVIAGTGDARCEPGELSLLGPNLFGGCPIFRSKDHGIGQGASVGAAHVTAALLRHTSSTTHANQLVSDLAGAVRYRGPERRTLAQS